MPIRGLVATLLVCLTLFVSVPAAAYVRAQATDTGVPLFWPNPQAKLEVTLPPDSFPIATDDVHAAAQAAVDAWSYPALDCTTVALTLAPGFSDGDVVARDGHNRIITRTGAWCRDPDAQTGCHDPSQVALTTIFSRSNPGALDDGEILEADIELNDVGYEWAVVPDGPFSARDYANAYDLQSALTHEVGHFIGLAHDCLMPGDGTRVDDLGDVSPTCTTVPASEASEILGATMFALMSPADTNWRTLSSDDTRAACALYSRQGAPVAGWCAVGAAPVDARSSVAVLAVTGAFMALGLGCRARRARSRARVG